MDYWEQQLVIVCKLCAGGHYTHQCEYNRNRPNFNWSYNQSGMQQSQNSSYPLQNQLYGQQFQHQYAPLQQQFQYPVHTEYGQQSNEESELEELRLMIKSNALSLQMIENQIGQIANALLNMPQETLPINTEANPSKVNSAVDEDEEFQEQQVEPIPTPKIQIEEIPEKSADQLEAEEKKNNTSAENSTPEKTTESIQIYPPPPSMKFPAKEEEYFSMDTGKSKEAEKVLKSDSLDNLLRGESDTKEEEKAEHDQLVIVAPWLKRCRIPHVSLGLVDLLDSRVRLKIYSKEAPILELMLDHLRYVSCQPSILLAIVIATNVSGRRENNVSSTFKERRKLKLVIKDVAPEKIIKWPYRERGSCATSSQRR